MDQPIPKKRKRSSSSSQNPFAGIFTRSKSQIYLHCHRSGRARSDSVRRTKYHDDLWSTAAEISSKKCKQKSQTEEEDTSHSTPIDDWSSSFIKDLRTRRVFSLASISDASEEEKKGATEDGLSSDYVHSASLIEKEAVEESKSDLEFPSHEQNITKLQVDELNTGNCVDGDISAEECVQATPPDAEIVQKLSVTSDGVPDNIDRKDSCNSEPVSVLRSRSRVKVFSAPYLFSYRRLLPYLTGIAQDNSCAATNHKCSNVKNQTMIADETKVDNSMETLAGGDMKLFGDELSASAHHISDSAIGIPPQKDSSSSPTPLDGELCSKNFVDSRNENIQKSLDGEESGEKHQVCEEDEVSTMQTEESVGIQVFDLRGSNRGAIDVNPLGSYVSSEGENNTKKEGDDKVVGDKIVDSNEESIGMTLPGVGIIGNAIIMAYQNADNGVEHVSQSAGHVLGRPVNEIVPQDNSCSSVKRMNSSSKRKLGLSPCSQLKLFKARSSFSYRRLLPILMDIAKDSSGDPVSGHCPNVEKKMVEENLLSPLPMCVDETRAHNKLSRVAMGKQSSNHETGCLVASDHNKSENPDSQEQELQVLEVISDESKQDTMTNDVVLGDSEEDSKTVGIQESSFKVVDDDDALEIENPPVKKGILKRKGCRGPCTCLKCCSFRLNAERAFEFSKNQMLDAEEVALDLIKELSHLRNILLATDASAASTHNHINQVKEAFVRASEAEEVAKSRLAQMKYDLNIHSRTTDGQRPRVKFANNVE